MKKIVLGTLACLAIFIFSGCTHFSSLQKNSWQKYENNRFGFTVEYPKDWMVVLDEDYGVMFSNTPLSKWAHGLGVPVEDGGMWVEINRIEPNDCHNNDYEPIFDEPDIGISKTQFKFICKDGLIIVLGFNPKSDNPESEKKFWKIY